MRGVAWLCVRLVLLAGLLGAAAVPCLAAEGTTAAGPIAGTDIRSAVLPPPGLYGGGIGAHSHPPEGVDGQGKALQGPGAGRPTRGVAAPVLGPGPNAQGSGG